MTFDFEAAIKNAGKKSNLIEAIVLGQQGAGKSRLLGTMPGKILYLYTTGESHGYNSASVVSADRIVPICIDVSQKTSEKLAPDAAYDQLLAILDDMESLKKHKFTSIVVDGASEIEALIRETDKFKELCTSNSGKHNTFAEPSATISMFRPIIAALKRLQRIIGTHFAVTCRLDVKDMGGSGEVLEASPQLQGYQVAESLVAQFNDVLVVGRMEKDGVIKHKLQFMTDIAKVSKDGKTGQIKKMMNFSPRIAGLEDLPAIMNADLNEIAILKGSSKVS